MAATEFACTVKTFKNLTPTVFQLGFEAAQPLEFKAGQFISVIVPKAGPNGRDLRRAYSIASAPEERPIELCVKLVDGGPGTNFLNSLRPGEAFRGYAPYGNFVYEPKAGSHSCFIATGTGIAPFRSMIRSAAFRTAPPMSAHCLLGVRTEDELLYGDEFRSVKGLNFIEAVSQPSGSWKGFKGRVTDYLRALGSSFPWLSTEFYLCGNGAMIAEIKAILAENGVGTQSIHQEIYYK